MNAGDAAVIGVNRQQHGRGRLTLSDHPYLQTKRITTASFHLNTSSSISSTFRLNTDSSGCIPALVQIRHRMKPVSAIVRPRTAPRLPPDAAATSHGVENGIECTFDEPVVGVAPGQVAATGVPRVHFFDARRGYLVPYHRVRGTLNSAVRGSA